MAIIRKAGKKIVSITSSIPSYIEKNHDIDWISENDKKKLIDNIGVKERRIADPTLMVSDYAVHACKEALKAANISSEKISLLLLITQTGDHQIPSTAIKIHKKLELDHNCLALEVNLGCSGYVYGLWLISSLMENTPVDSHAILVVGDISTATLEPKDSGTIPLFSDGASATLLKNTNTTEWTFNLHNDGSEGDSIKMFGEKKFEFIGNSFLKLNGLNIYKFAITQVVPNITDLLKAANIESEKVDFYILHQASKIINEAIRRKLQLSLDKFPSSLEKFGNTSSATIPITICENFHNMSGFSQKLLLCGFGTGLSWGSLLLDFNPEIILAPLDFTKDA